MSLEGEGGTPRLTSKSSRGLGRVHRFRTRCLSRMFPLPNPMPPWTKLGSQQSTRKATPGFSGE